VWVDLTEYLPPEVDVLKGERQLTERLVEGGVYLAPVRPSSASSLVGLGLCFPCLILNWE